MCMVCFEDTSEDLYFDMCKCKGVAVHAACFEKMLRVPSHRMKCAVCHASYGFFVTEHESTAIKCSHKTNVLTVMLLHTMYPLGFAGMWYTANHMLVTNAIVVPAIVLAMCTCVTSSSVALLVFVHGVWGCIERHKIVRYKINFGLLRKGSTTVHV